MKKALISIISIALIITAVAAPVFGDDLSGGDWKVTCTSENKLVSDFGDGDITETISGMEPGDSATFQVSISSESSEKTDWYMENSILYSLEDRSSNKATSGGGYTYSLIYYDKDGSENILFSSDNVGGEGKSPAGVGLHQATDALDDYFWLGEYSNGDSGKVVLKVSLDGETQGNDYQTTLADLALNFAVEIKTASPTTTYRIVRTGDETNLTPYYVAMTGSGLVLMVIAVLLRSKRRVEERY